MKLLTLRRLDEEVYNLGVYLLVFSQFLRSRQYVVINRYCLLYLVAISITIGNLGVFNEIDCLAIAQN